MFIFSTQQHYNHMQTRERNQRTARGTRSTLFRPRLLADDQPPEHPATATRSSIFNDIEAHFDELVRAENARQQSNEEAPDMDVRPNVSLSKVNMFSL